MKNKTMEDLEERTCLKCKIVKKKEGFDIHERKNGDASVCMSCREEDLAMIRRVGAVFGISMEGLESSYLNDRR